MAKKKIISVGYEIPGHSDKFIAFRSDKSLFDADIIIFQPSLSYYSREKNYLGKPKLYESDSFQLKEDSAHWRSELKTAFDSGKTIFIFLIKLEKVYVDTGEKQHSGTGRSRITTNIVSDFDNYKSIPLKFGKITPKSGKEIKVVKDLKYLSQYWKEFSSLSGYEVYLENEYSNPILKTKTGEKIVGFVHSKDKGTMILIPPIRYDKDVFIEYNEEEGRNYWTEEAMTFGEKLISHLIEIDKAIHSSQDLTPPPEWTQKTEYRTKNEGVLEKKINDTTEKIEKLSMSRSEMFLQLEQEGVLRKLLYERGHQLEDAIIEAIKLFGFQVSKYRDSESEFDLVFESAEGRFIGEAEGKDNKAINIDKLSQLERNIQEDFARDDILDYAKGVLFGNAFRLKPPEERTPEFFTKKCLSGAERSKIVLGRTTDLFQPAKYLKENKNSAYAKKCREVFSKTEGDIITFPQPPQKAKRNRRK